MIEVFRTLPDLPQELRGLAAQVPAGRVTTCGWLAEALGSPLAARWIGHFMLHHEHGEDCPCHRVVRAGGQLGGFVGGTSAAKALRLAAEGVEIRGETIDLDRFGFRDFRGDRPLERLRQVQETITKKASLRAPRRMPRLVGGVDVSYPNAAEGVAAYALVDLDDGRLAWSTTVRRPVRFPYITSFLAFREMPILLDLLDEVRSAGWMADLVLVDGSGILHQRHAGIATHLGIVAGLSTIGVTKKLLCGTVDVAGMEPHESRPVLYEDRVVGAAVRPTAGSRRPVFVSPGHRVSLAMAEAIVRRLLLGRRLPEPLYWADRLSRCAGRSEGTMKHEG
jgi:deoxyribonuclease V